jgi:hypothetical protein
MGAWRRAPVAIADKFALVLALCDDAVGPQVDIFELLYGEWATKSSFQPIVFGPSSDSDSDTGPLTSWAQIQNKVMFQAQMPSMIQHGIVPPPPPPTPSLCP